MPHTDTRPTWTHTNPNLTKPSALYLAPSFQDHLGSVFIGIGDWDRRERAWAPDSPDQRSHHGVWLDKDALAELRRKLDEIEKWSEAHGDGYEPDVIGWETNSNSFVCRCETVIPAQGRSAILADGSRVCEDCVE